MDPVDTHAYGEWRYGVLSIAQLTCQDYQMNKGAQNEKAESLLLIGDKESLFANLITLAQT